MWKNIRNFENNFRVNTHNTRSGDHYDPAFYRLTLTQRQSIFYQAPKNWRDITDPIINSPSLKTFKRIYKQSLMSSYQE